jgi:hypothetical protein
MVSSPISFSIANLGSNESVHAKYLIKTMIIVQFHFQLLYGLLFFTLKKKKSPILCKTFGFKWFHFCITLYNIIWESYDWVFFHRCKWIFDMRYL